MRVLTVGHQVVYIPSQKSNEFQSFSVPLLNVHDTHVSAPFFGPNQWMALVQPVSGGGIPPALPAVQLKVTFKEGGAFDFHNHFERIKERFQQAVDVSPEGSRGTRNVDMSAVHLDELPAYTGPSQGPTTPGLDDNPSGPSPDSRSETADRAATSGTEPMEPPPGYEEVQQQSVANALEARLRRGS